MEATKRERGDAIEPNDLCAAAVVGPVVVTTLGRANQLQAECSVVP